MLAPGNALDQTLANAMRDTFAFWANESKRFLKVFAPNAFHKKRLNIV